ncbi:MAG: hypothetical protein ACE15F_04340 [bacterium]
MNTPNIKTGREKMILYVEAAEWGGRDLTEPERREIEDLLARDESARRDVEAIAAHLRFLRNTPAPRVPENLAARCLETIQRRSAPRRAGWGARRNWAYGLAFAVIVIFAAGIWVGQRIPGSPESQFQILLQEQTQLVARLERGLAGRYHEAVLTADNPWHQPIADLKKTTQALTVYHGQTRDNLVIQHGLCIAIAQNISVLQALCDYIEKKQAIPDFDVKFFDTAPSGGNMI